MAQHIILGAGELTRSNFMEKISPHLDLVKQAAIKYCHGDVSLADDMVQETLLKAYSNISKFNGGNFGAWIYRILHNNIVSHYRKTRGSDTPASHARKHYTVLSIQDHRDKVENSLAISNGDNDFLAVDKIRNAIESLPEYMRNVFKLAAIDELDYKQVAQKLKMPIGTVMSRIFRARKTLQRKLQSMVNDN